MCCFLALTSIFSLPSGSVPVYYSFIVLGIWNTILTPLGFHGGSDHKESVCTVGDTGAIPGLGRSPGEGNIPTLVFFLENSMDREAW